LKKIIIAIDGPAASGKSTTAKYVARELGYLHIDTGAMYRAMALKILRCNISPTDSAAIAKLAHSTSIRLITSHESNAKVRVELDGVEVSDEIRSPEVTQIVSPVSTIAEVRSQMVKEQRAMGVSGGIVLEGRDIGTVVFPDAELKVYLIADVHERALRRRKDLERSHIDVSVEQLERQLIERDTIDSHREISPLKKADNAFEIDTTHLSIEQQVAIIVQKAKAIIEQ
jgi:cytidylate kinase